MFWEMDVEGHRAALGSISDFLLSVFAFAASKRGWGIPAEGMAGLRRSAGWGMVL